MDTATTFGLVLAVIWGGLWALFLQRTYQGRFMAARLTWLTVVIGIGVDLLIALMIIPLDVWLRVAGIIAASSVAIISRSLLNDSSDHRALLERHANKNARSE